MEQNENHGQRKKAKIVDLEFFEGDRKKFRDFETQLQVKFVEKGDAREDRIAWLLNLTTERGSLSNYIYMNRSIKDNVQWSPE